VLAALLPEGSSAGEAIVGSNGVKRFRATFILACWAYLAITGFIFMPYHNWRYAREHGFLSWIFFGELSASARALAWPYFVFVHASNSATADPLADWTPLEKANSKHFLLSVQADLQSIQLARERMSTPLSSGERNEILALKETALQEARLVTPVTLRKIHPDLPRHLNSEYIPGLEYRIRHLRSSGGDEEAERKGIALLDSWADWFNANKDAILIPK
jgi:hypothetical protein